MEKPTKVLQVLDFINYNSGVSAVVMNYYFHMAKEKVQCDFLLYEQTEKEWQDKLTAQGAKIYVSGQPSGRNIHAYRRKIEAFFSQHGKEYDVVHVHIPNAAFVVLRSAQKYGIPVRILHSHNARGADGLMKKIRNFVLNKWGIHYANRYYACSKNAGRYLFGKRKCEELFIVNNAIDLNRYQYNAEKRKKIRTQLGIAEETLLGHIGRFEEQKNHRGLVEILGKLCRRGWNGKLILFGEGKLRTEIEQLVHKQNLQERVIFAGVVDNIQDYMSAMDIFLLPSLYEGLPVVCVEAQAAGLPCIVSDRVTEEIKLSEGLVFLDHQDIERWCEAVLKSECNEHQRIKVDKAQLMVYDIIRQSQRLEAEYRALSICEKER